MQQKNHRIRVLIADDSPTALRSVCRFLEQDGRFEILGTASDGESLLEQAKRLWPDLVLADLSMPVMNGLEVASELHKSFPGLRVLIFSGLHGASIGEECLRRGADGFVGKSEMPEKLMEEIERLFAKDS